MLIQHPETSRAPLLASFEAPAIQAAASVRLGLPTEAHLGRLLSGMMAKGHGAEALCFFLALTRDALYNLLVDFGLPSAHDRPMRRTGGPRAWSAADYSVLMTCWLTNWRVELIAARLGRSKGSVYYQARRLGLPSRDRRALFQTSLQLGPVLAMQGGAAGKGLPKLASADENTWLIQGIKDRIEMRWRRAGKEVLGTDAYHRFVAKAKWCGLANSKIAEMCRVTKSVIDNAVMRMEIPRVPKERRFDVVSDEAAANNMQVAGYIEARSKAGYLYWRSRRSWTISRRDKISVAYRYA